ncbi:MAG: hydantoinase/oxoprolinase family protein [Acetobacteraceae bacterium]|nr:hydantoinase/oxoprolinase family protein [Acetobacteraceae bacterium]
MRRIGIDVGGTNTDAVLIEDDAVRCSVKTATSEDVLGGIRTALSALLAATASADETGPLDAVVIGTTHFTNAVIERRGLQRVGALRIGLPASASLPPFVDWPEDLAAMVCGVVEMVAGGHEYDGRPIVPLDRSGVRDAARRMADQEIAAVGISSVFSPLTAECEEEAARIVREELPEASITLSHDLGRIGLLERENVTLLNASLQDLARRVTDAFTAALGESGIVAPLYLSQNDGTIMRTELARRFPVYGFASGPTNSMRGAAYLSGLAEGVVVDVGGTTSDIGYLKDGFPREANAAVDIGGVRTLFRMPDLLSLGLGGGTIIAADRAPDWQANWGPESRIGPESVGFRLSEEAIAFGGRTLTASDVAIAAGRLTLGEPARLARLDRDLVARLLARMAAMLAEGVDRMKTEAGDVPLLAVGGGSFLIPDRLEGCSEVIRVPHYAVANAVGAAIAQVSGEVDQVFAGLSRAAAITAAQELAQGRAVAAGARRESLQFVEVEDIPLSYLPGDARRVRVRVIGDIGA